MKLFRSIAPTVLIFVAMTILTAMAASGYTPNLPTELQYNKPVLVDFYAEWCGSCKVLKPYIEDLKAKMGEKLQVIHMDVDHPGNAKYVQMYRIYSTPTYILFNAKGNPVYRTESGFRISTLRNHVIEETQKAPAKKPVALCSSKC